jgi:hypothetical protein
VAIDSAGQVNTRSGLADLDASVQASNVAPVQSTEFRQIGSKTYTNAAMLGATGTEWVVLNSATQGSEDAVIATNSLVAGLTPRNTLAALAFPLNSFGGTPVAGGTQYQAQIGKSTLAAILPLSELTPLGSEAVFGNEAVPVTVVVNKQGLVSQFTASFQGLSITVNLQDFGKAFSVVAPSGAGDLAS